MVLHVQLETVVQRIILKTTNCCQELKAMHHNCSIKFSSKNDSTYKFDQSTYEGDKKVKLLCIKCNEKIPL